jgi:MoaA/NifB/PqqE/SkfB family radical SAM enzyme
MKRINYILGNQCNSNCSHCFTNASTVKSKSLTPDIAINVFEKLNANSAINEIHFNGGEPFLYAMEMNEIISKVIKIQPNVVVKIATGAFEFKTESETETILSQIPKIDEIWASIDSFHLKQTSLQNYVNLKKYCTQNKIRLVFSICYTSALDFANMLCLLEENDLIVDEIAKQPVYPFGRAASMNIVPLIDFTIPKDFYCPETDIVSVWPTGKLTTCSALCARNGKIKKQPGVVELLEHVNNDEHFNLRNKLSFKEIAEVKKIDGPFDISSPCATCSSIIEQWT